MMLYSSRLARSSLPIACLLISLLIASHSASAQTGSAMNPPVPAVPPASSAAPVPGQEIDKDSGLPIVTTPTGLKYVDLLPGAGAAIKTGDQISVNYVGKLVDGTVFDASDKHGGPFSYVQGVTSLIAGWTEGTSTMHVGGKRKLIIPPDLGYGLQGAGDVIPPNATLVFEIEVVSAQPAAPGAH